MILKHPWVLFFIPLVLGLVYALLKGSKPAAIRFPSMSLLEGLSASFKIFLSQKMIWLRFVVISLLIVALARAQKPLQETQVIKEGIDIVLAIDASGSMAAEDFMINTQRVNRLAIVKEIVKEFIQNRDADKIGLVAFGGRAYTVCPLTRDYDWLLKNLERVELGLIEDGTAVGSAISSALARIKNSETKSKIIILLTDGVNNAGTIKPVEAAQIAKNTGVRIYTIGAGSKGLVPYPVEDVFGRKMYRQVQLDLDEEMLQKIADITSGQYFRATNTESLRQIYKEIDALEKTKIEESGYREYKELFTLFLLPAMGLLILEIVLRNTVLVRIP